MAPAWAQGALVSVSCFPGELRGSSSPRSDQERLLPEVEQKHIQAGVSSEFRSVGGFVSDGGCPKKLLSVAEVWPPLDGEKTKH